MFLAPSGAQEMQMFVCLSDESLSRAHDLHISGSGLSQVFYRSVSAGLLKSLFWEGDLFELVVLFGQGLGLGLWPDRKVFHFNVCL